jgi:peroxiredoxin
MKESRKAAAFAAIIVACLLTAACGQAPEEKFMGTWRVAMVVPGGDLPFGLEIGREHGNNVAWLLNGPERARVTDVSLLRDRVIMRMPGYPNTLDARLVDGRLVGEIDFLRPGGRHTLVKFEAQHGVTWRFFPKASEKNGDFNGRWVLTFHNPDTGAESTGIAELSQRGHIVTGTVLRDSGDDRYIAGETRGDAVFLSRFDGGSGYLYVAHLTPDGRLEGEFRTATGAFRQLAGHRDANARLPDDSTLTRLEPDAGPIDFTLPDVNGRQVSLRDQRFRDKVIILAIGGTWCPNCHDEAVFLRKLLRKRANRGLEVVQLMFEYSDDFASASASVRSYIDKFQLNYPVLIAGGYAPGAVKRVIPQLESFYAYPTTLVIDRQGKLRYAHAGFSGPATGKHYDEFSREFSKLLDVLLAESPGTRGGA